jgi:hypothetical protein
MKFMILFDGKTYVTEAIPEAVSPDQVRDKHPGFFFFDFATSVEDAESKIQQDRDRNSLTWY